MAAAAPYGQFTREQSCQMVRVRLREACVIYSVGSGVEFEKSQATRGLNYMAIIYLFGTSICSLFTRNCSRFPYRVGVTVAVASDSLL